MPEPPALRASIALAAYAESLVDGRRVIVFGDASSRLAEHLLDRGARLIHVYDPDPTRVAEAATRNTERNITFAPLAESGLAVRDGTFDAAIVENLSTLGDARSILKRVRRALSPRGVALVACPSPEARAELLPEPERGAAVDYYALYDAVSEHFENVRMLGQTPFVGYAVIDFAPEGEPEPAFDAGFVPGGAEEPEWFIALGAQEPRQLDEFLVVEIAWRAALGAGDTRRAQDQVHAARAAERRALERVGQVEAESSELRAQIGALKARADDASELNRLRAELQKREVWITELEARAATADARADAAQAELDHERALARSAEQAVRAHAPPPDTARVTELEQELGEQRDATERLEAILAEREQRLKQLLAAEPADGGAEIGALEAQLSNRAERIRALEDELAEAERIGRELVLELEARGNAPGPVAELGPAGELKSKLDALASLNAEREADLTAARWRIVELEAKLAEARSDEEQRQALEHDLRRTRAEVQKLATLVAQLRLTKPSGGAEAQ
jgi:SAM-dependent methyltransferase